MKTPDVIDAEFEVVTPARETPTAPSPAELLMSRIDRQLKWCDAMAFVGYWIAAAFVLGFLFVLQAVISSESLPAKILFGP